MKPKYNCIYTVDDQYLNNTVMISSINLTFAFPPVRVQKSAVEVLCVFVHHNGKNYKRKNMMYWFKQMDKSPSPHTRQLS